MKNLCSELNLLQNDAGLVRVPFLVKGTLVPPPEISLEHIIASFHGVNSGCTCVRLPGAQAVREPIIDRLTMECTGDYLYQLIPDITARELVETDIDALVYELYSLSVADILDWLETVIAAVVNNKGFALQVRDLCQLTSQFPDAMLDGWFSAFPSILSREAGRRMIDAELSFWDKPGGEFLEDWVKLDAELSPEWLRAYASTIYDNKTEHQTPDEGVFVRAMPTRQLHITAGNAPEVPLISALRAVLTKSAAVIKLPYGALLPGALLSVAAAAGAPRHPLTRHLSMVYWPGGDESIENELFSSGMFDRIVVWGSPDTVASVTSRSIYTRTICLNPRYGVSMIGAEAFNGLIDEAARNAAIDVMTYNQKACTSSLIHYVESTEEQAKEYAAHLAIILEQWESKMPNFVPPVDEGHIKRLKRGRYARSDWIINQRHERFTSGVVVVSGEFDILEHPMCRLVIVRPVPTLEHALNYLHPGVSAVGIFPEKQRLALRDRVATRGVSSVIPLGRVDRFFSGMPHDGMRVLSDLVDWKTA